MDEGRRAATQSLFEGENACGGRCESNEANRGGGPAKGEDDRNWSRSPALRIATHDGSPKSGGPLGASVCAAAFDFAQRALRPSGMRGLTLASRPEQIENMLHPTREVNSPRVAAVRPRVSAPSSLCAPGSGKSRASTGARRRLCPSVSPWWTLGSGCCDLHPAQRHHRRAG